MFWDAVYSLRYICICVGTCIWKRGENLGKISPGVTQV